MNFPDEKNQDFISVDKDFVINANNKGRLEKSMFGNPEGTEQLVIDSWYNKLVIKNEAITTKKDKLRIRKSEKTDGITENHLEIKRSVDYLRGRNIIVTTDILFHILSVKKALTTNIAKEAKTMIQNLVYV